MSNTFYVNVKIDIAIQKAKERIELEKEKRYSEIRQKFLPIDYTGDSLRELIEDYENADDNGLALLKKNTWKILQTIYAYF